jgi:prophage antirepressor-like protein
MNKNNDFFMDVFNHLLKVNEDNVLIVFDKDGNIWFSFRDILKALKYNNIDNAINTIIVNDLFKQKYKNIRVSSALETLKNMQPEQIFINESGLYEVLSNSTKPLAKQFMHKYFTDIMPKIRQTGKYILDDTDKKKLDKMNDKLNNYKQELTYYYDKYHFVPSKAGYLYINLDKSIKNGKNINCYKIGYAKNMKKRLKEYKVGNFKHKPLCYIPIDVNKKEIENCVKARNKPHLTKLITDSICFMSLNDLKEEITDCIEFLKSHICNCLHCKKQYEFKNITTHECNKIE